MPVSPAGGSHQPINPFSQDKEKASDMEEDLELPPPPPLKPSGSDSDDDELPPMGPPGPLERGKGYYGKENRPDHL